MTDLARQREGEEAVRLSDADKLRVLATWFDNFDDWREATGKIAPGITDYRDVQEDLRRIADGLDEAHAAGRAEALGEVRGAVKGISLPPGPDFAWVDGHRPFIAAMLDRLDDIAALSDTAETKGDGDA